MGLAFGVGIGPFLLARYPPVVPEPAKGSMIMAELACYFLHKTTQRHRSGGFTAALR